MRRFGARIESAADRRMVRAAHNKPSAQKLVVNNFRHGLALSNNYQARDEHGQCDGAADQFSPGHGARDNRDARKRRQRSGQSAGDYR